MSLLPKLSMRRLRRLAVWAAAALALFALVGFFALPPLLKSILTDKLSVALHRKVEIGEIKVNPFALSVTIRNVKVREREGAETFAGFEEFYVNLGSTSLFRRAAIVQEIRLTRPYARIVRQKEFTYNFSDLLQGQTPPPKDAKPSPPPRFFLGNLQVVDASVDFLDEPVQKKHTVRKANLTVPFLSNIPSQVNLFVEPVLSAEINGTQYAAKGKTKPFADSLETQFEINIANLDIPYYLAYSPVPLRFAVPSGQLNARTTITFIQPKQESSSLVVKGNIALKDLAVDDLRKSPVVRLQALEVEVASAEPFAKKVHLARIAMQSPKLTVRREKTGTTNLETLLPTQAPPAKGSQPAAPAKAPEPAPAGQAFVLDIDRIELSDGGVFFTDLSTPTPFKARLEPISLGVNQFSNRRDAKTSYALSLGTEARESITVEGTLSVDPLAADGVAEVKSVPLKRYAPYYAERVLFDIESGRLDLSARYHYAQADGGPEIRASDIAVTLNALGLRRRGESQDFVQIPSFAIKGTTIDLTQARVTVGAIATQQGAIKVVRLPNGEFDLQKLLPPPAPADAPQPAPVKAQAGPKPAESKPWVVTLERLSLDQYAVTLEDRTLPQPVTLLAEQIKLTGENLSTAKGVTGKLGLALVLDKATTLSSTAAVSLDPLRAQGSLELSGLPLKQYAPYYQDRILFDIADGELDLATNFEYAQKDAAPDAKLSGLAVSLKALRLKGRKEQDEFLSVPAFAIRNTGVDLAERQLVVGELSTQGGMIRVKRSRNGEINLLKLVPPAPALAASPPAAPAAAPEKPWVVRLEAAAIEGYAIQVEDAVPAEPVTLSAEEIALKAIGFSLQKGESGTLALSMRINQTGTLKTEGSVGLSPLRADLAVTIQGIDLRPVQPYFTDRVKIVITDGSLSAAGRLALAPDEAGELHLGYKGETSLNQFASIDKREAQDFLRWDSLALHEIDAGVNPFRFRAKSVALSQFFARVLVRPDGTVNLQDILEKGEAPAEPRAGDSPKAGGRAPVKPAPAPAPAPPPAPAQNPIKIEQVTLQGGRVSFSDASVKPSYTATMVEIGGRVSGLSSEPGTLADLDLRGKLENYAPLEITGKINPLGESLYADIRARFKDMDLSPLTPYSGKYVGYTIEKGKLAFDLKYLIDKRKLESQNVISVDQFTFGDKVDSPQATRLPVKLAIALLKDRNGLIRLDIPVTGSLDDPQFSIWRIVFQIIGNLIVKAVTSPFALLGSLFGGGEELSQIEFDYGSAAVAGPNLDRVAKLAKALRERPGLRLDIHGYVDAERDRDALLRELFTRKLQAQKVLDQSRRGGPRVPLEQVKIEQAEYAKYLKLAYDFERFPKPRTGLGLVRDLPPAEMEKLMLTHVQVTEDDLRALASQRARAILDALTQPGEIDPERIFILEGKSLSPEKKNSLKASRAEFTIK